MLLIYPPLAKACEPPGGLPILGGALKAHNTKYKIVDFNLEGTNYLLNCYFNKFPKKEHYRNQLTSSLGYKNIDTYKKCINELNKGLNYLSNKETTLTLANYESSKYDITSSKELIRIAANYKDNIFYDFYSLRLIELVNELNPGYIGISLQFLNQAESTFALIGFIKNTFPNIKIVVGGGLITSWAKSPYWENPFVDIIDKIIVGQGEVELLKYLNVNIDSSEIENIIPDYDFTLNYKYFSNGRIIPISGSLGCSWKKCSFCPENAENNPFITKKTLNIINEMKILKEKYNPVLFHFLDNEISPSLLKKIIESKNIVPWYGFTKFYDLLLDPLFCLQLKEAGCFMLKLGLESGNQDVLNFMNKGIDLKNVSIILNNLKKADIKTFIYILFGTPYENYSSAKDTLNYVLEHNELITYLNVALFNLPLGSELAKEYSTYDYTPTDLSLYSGFIHPNGWNRKEVRTFINEEIKTKPEIKKILNRTLPIYNANHAFFLKDQL
ncbi:MAG: radical SAM protein [Spirochaetales bacterium]|nr:radical SAM protein [Spirochaetales bacterium]